MKRARNNTVKTGRREIQKLKYKPGLNSGNTAEIMWAKNASSKYRDGRNKTGPENREHRICRKQTK